MVENKTTQKEQSGIEQTCKTRETSFAGNDCVICEEIEPCEKVIRHPNDYYCLKCNVGFKYNGNRSKSKD